MPSKKETISQMLTEGCDYRAIAAIVGCSERYVRQIMTDSCMTRAGRVRKAEQKRRKRIGKSKETLTRYPTLSSPIVWCRGCGHWVHEPCLQCGIMRLKERDKLMEKIYGHKVRAGV